MQVKINQATSMVTDYIKAGIVPMIHGSPGIGKSQIVHQIAEEYGLKLVDMRLSQCDPTDLAGFPQIDTARQKAGYLPMDTFPLEGEQPPAGYNGWLLFFDEANSAPKAVQAAAYKIILDRMIGQRALHKKCALVAAGNLETDGAIVEEMSTALQSRMSHIELVVDPDTWVEWAQKNNIHHMITSYIQFKPGQLYTFKPDHTDKTYACPRTWEFANRIMKVTTDDSPNRLPMLAGTLSEGVAREFRTFCKIYDDLPKPAQIIAAPDTLKVPTEPSILYALTGSISHNATTDNFGALMQYIKRLPVEFQVVTMRETIRRNKSMMSHAAVQKWVTESAANLF
jgi:nucleoside diphosphate kinase